MDPTQLYQNVAQPQQPAAPTPAQPQQASPQAHEWLDKLGGFLSHPAVQGLLGAYFGAVSSPRHGGLGTAIGRAGFGGLGQMGQAQALQQQQKTQALKAQEEAAALNMQAQGVDISRQRLGLEQQKQGGIGLPAAKSYIARNPDLGKQYPVEQLAAMSPNEVREAITSAGVQGLRKDQMAQTASQQDFQRQMGMQNEMLRQQTLAMQAQQHGDENAFHKAQLAMEQLNTQLHMLEAGKPTGEAPKPTLGGSASGYTLEGTTTDPTTGDVSATYRDPSMWANIKSHLGGEPTVKTVPVPGFRPHGVTGAPAPAAPGLHNAAAETPPIPTGHRYVRDASGKIIGSWDDATGYHELGK